MDQVWQVELKRVFGEVYFRARRATFGAIVYGHWYGAQSEETVKGGGHKYLEMIREEPFTKLLNSNEHVIGSWDMALEWAEKEWAPQMRKAGLRYLAYVVPTSIYATMTVESLIQRIGDEFEIRTFDDRRKAEAWLQSVGT
ncbi:hypothetical protein [Rufibacter roseolus]|uniref:hypothetical protein n=1 Tax=Rufibacter roseolus TaxID=2817375 RepID=UPI001B31597F|nr:hypothetical protein [Rufibacter roseolus]